MVNASLYQSSPSAKLYPLSSQQKNIWHLEQLYPNSSIAIVSGTLKIHGEINVQLMQRAVNTYLENDDSIRTHITLVDGEPMQYTSKYRQSLIDYFDFSTTRKEGQYLWDIAVTRQPFVLLDSDLFYFAIIKTSENDGGILIKTHHIISDGWSIVLISNRIMDNYLKLIEGQQPSEEKFPVYFSYLEREQEYLNSDQFEKDGEYWEEKVKNIPEQLGLKEYNLTNISNIGRRKTHILPTELTSKIRVFCADNSVSTFAVFFSALCAYMYRIRESKELVFGTPVLNRKGAIEKDMVGMFISTVPMMVSVDENLSFMDFSKYIIRQWLQALRHQRYPYDRIFQQARKLNGPLSRLFDITFSYQNAKLVKSDEYAAFNEGRWHYNGCQVESLCIHLNEREDDGRLIVDYDYLVQIFQAKEIDYIHEHIVNFLTAAMETPEKLLKDINVMSDEERQRVLFDFNKTDYDFGCPGTVHENIRTVMEKSPNAPAVAFNRQNISYRDLYTRSSLVASGFIRNGLQKEQVVGVLLPRSDGMILGMLGTLMAGGCIMLLDMTLPGSRIEYMLRDSRAKLLLTSKAIYEKYTREQRFDFPEKVVFIESLLDSEPAQLPVVETGNLAYAIYTSGSTGQPKGVMIEHGTLVNFAKAMEKYTKQDGAVISIATVSFDAFILETLVSLMNGRRLVMVEEELIKEPEYIAKAIVEQDVKAIYITPSRLRTMAINPKCFQAIGNLGSILCGGEDFPADLLRILRKLTDAVIYNQYGPTEATIGVTLKELDTDIIDIGTPLPNTKLYILDHNLLPLPVGVPGELYIGGRCLARGYIGGGSKNNEKFITSPFNPDERLYRTGDLARWYPRGEIAFLGRVDKQVKIRGFRIELGEIEDKIKRYPGIINAVVVDKRDANSNQYLCAYIVSAEKLLPLDIKRFLSQQLPYYMLPAFFISIDKIPLTMNGKVDYHRLPKVDAAVGRDSKYIAPSSKMETELVRMWHQILQTDIIGVTDNFFLMGGDSLSAINMIVEVQKLFDIRLKFTDIYQHPTIRELAELITNSKYTGFEAILPAPMQDYYPLSAEQKRIYILNKIEKNQTAYNMPSIFRVTGELDIPRLERAFCSIVQRHEIFRTEFTLKENALVQQVQAEVPFKIELYKGSAEECIKNFIRPFDLDKPPLIRAAVSDMGEKTYLLMVDMHHIASDGASCEILMGELDMLYNGELPPKVDTKYKDYVLWSESMQNSLWMQRQKAYWQDVFKDGVPILDLPFDRPRPPEPDFIGNKLRFSLSEKESVQITEFCKQQHVSLNMYFMAVFNLLLMKMSGQEDIVVGTPVRGRKHSDLERIIGVFINTVPIRTKPQKTKTFKQYLSEVCDTIISALDNQEYPFDRLVDMLPLKRDISRNPVFDIMFSMQNVSEHNIKLDSLGITPVELDTGVSKLDITLEAVEYAGHIEFKLEYACALFNADTIRRYAGYFKNLSRTVCRMPETCLGDIDCMDQKERELLVFGFNQTEMVYPDVTVDQLIDKQARLTPDKTAVLFNGQRISYSQLREKSDALAAAIMAQGVGPGKVVGILSRRSLEMMVGLLAVMKSGAAYMPIDPDYPNERIMYMIENSNTALLLYGGGITLPPMYCGQIMPLSARREYGSISNRSAGDCIYVLYTSGSTGKPKGVMVAHKSLVNYIEAMKCLPFSQDDVMLCSTTVCFDVFAIEGIMSLAMGMTVILADEEQQRVPRFMAKLIRDYEITAMQLTPSRMQVFLQDDAFKGAISQIKTLLLGGEALPDNLLKKLQSLTEARIFDMYGPTETTVYSACSELTNAQEVHIGKPIGNNRVYILDENKKLVPYGALGELYIAGDGVAIGYINNQALTNERFVLDTVRGQGRMYNTGDLARWRCDGNIEYAGRRDNQVKFRGLRIELGEIEACIMGSKLVKEAVVLPVSVGADTLSLCAYIIPNSGGVDTGELQRFLGKWLPEYMVPSYYVEMQSFPLTGSGKTDRKALPAPLSVFSKQAGRGPKNETEKILLEVWCEVFGRQDIDLEKSFFDQGGDSMGVILVQTKYFKQGYTITTGDFYRYPTIAQQAGLFAGAKQTEEKTVKNHAYPERIPSVRPVSEASMKHVLVTGATGFLGVHILYDLAKNTRAKITCLVRGEQAKKRLEDCINWYFEEGVPEQAWSRIFVLQGDVADEKLGLTSEAYSQLASVDTVIHAAADVRHYGELKEFEITNVQGSKNIIEFAFRIDAKLYHVSTVSVSGDLGGQGGKYAFSERDFYIGQDFENNVYVKTKFEAEAAVIQAMQNGLKASILRVGNLVGRYEDGQFQKNIEANAFYKRLQAIVMLGCAPKEYINIPIEFTPVDLCASAIVRVASQGRALGGALHLVNPRPVSLKKLIESFGLNDFEWLSKTEFTWRMKQVAGTEDSKFLAGLMQDIAPNGDLKLDSGIKLETKITQEMLSQYGFEWPEMDKAALERLYTHMESRKFILANRG